MNGWGTSKNEDDSIESLVARYVVEAGVDSGTRYDELLWSDHSNKDTGISACKQVGEIAKASVAGFRVVEDRAFYSDTFEFGD